MATAMALRFSKTTFRDAAASRRGERPNLARMCFFRSLPIPRLSTGVSQRHETYPSARLSSALHDESPETAAAWQMDVALRDAEFDNVALSRQETASALATASTRDVSILAALALARIGDTAKAKHLADDLAGRFPLNTVINRYWLPTIYASIEIDRGNPARAVELLQTTPSTNSALPFLNSRSAARSIPYMSVARPTCRCIRARRRQKSFKKYLDHSGVAVNCPLAALARLQLARAYVLTGDTTRAAPATWSFLCSGKTPTLTSPSLNKPS